MGLDPKFIMELKGNKFVLVAGLLELAHQKGLCGVDSEVLIDLSDPKEQFWVVRCTGRFLSENGVVEYSAHGDASPASSQMRGAYLRHAETRAFARMARIATNVAMTAFEELGGPDEERETASHPVPANGQGRAARAGVVSHRPQKTPAVEPAGEAVPPACEACGVVLSAALAAASQRHFQRNFCADCGKAHVQALRAEVEGAAA